VALTAALRLMIADAGLREHFSRTARASPMPTWEDAAQAFLVVLQTAA
jgi:hypothetical protein